MTLLQIKYILVTIKTNTNMLTSKIKAKPLLGITLAACSTAIAFQVPTQAGTKNITQTLVRASEVINQSLPAMLNQEIRMDSTSVEPGRTFNYNFSFVNRSAVEIDGNHYAQVVRPEMVQHICDNLYNSILRENKISISVRFHDSHKNFFSMIKVAPEDCR